MQYEQLVVWQRSYKLAVAVYRELSALRDFSFKDQISRSALSVPSNIAEGFERFSDKEKARFVSIAKGSCGEFKTQAMIAKDVGYISAEVCSHWQSEAEQISRMLGALMKTLRVSAE